MTNKQICEYVRTYIEKDKTKSAIMLVAPWDKGKSYFVQNELRPYVNEISGYQCVIVSLYGVSSLAEVSKSVYFVAKSIDIKKKLEKVANKKGKSKWILGKKKIPSELIPTTKVLGTTIIKSFTSLFGINFSIENLDELYNSIDLSRKILVFEDVERAKIDVIEFLGYVNSIVEQDGVKVLLICNEEELIHYTCEEIDQDGERRIIKKRTPESLQYLKIKEKTVSDTIQFKGNTKKAIGEIIENYDSSQLIRFKQADKLNELDHLLGNAGIDNLRTFMFACQKTYEIFEKIEKFQLNDKYLELIFYGIVLFSKSIKEGSFPEWEGTTYLSTKLTQDRIPLLRFCYNYIRWHELDLDMIEPALVAYDEYKMTISPNDADLEVLFNYWCLTEKSVLDALQHINQRLDDWTEIPQCTYGKLAYYLVKLHFVLNYDYSSIKNKMLENLRAHGGNVVLIQLMLPFYEFESDEEKLLVEDFRNEMMSCIKEAQESNDGFSYTASEIKSIVKKAENARNGEVHRFVSLYNSEKIVDMLFQCTAQQIDDFRGALFLAYRNSTSEDFEEADRIAMQEMLDRIYSRKKNHPKQFDKIQLLQMNYLCDNLKRFINQLK